AGGNCLSGFFAGRANVGSQLNRHRSLSIALSLSVRKSSTFRLSGKSASQRSQASDRGEIAGLSTPAISPPLSEIPPYIRSNSAPGRGGVPVDTMVLGTLGTITSGPRSPTRTG